MKPRLIGAGLSLAAVAAIAVALATGAGSPPPVVGPTRVALPSLPANPGYARTIATPSPASGLSHARPPDPQALRDAPARQAAFDAEARPGEFVTPPNVSVEH